MQISLRTEGITFIAVFEPEVGKVGFNLASEVGISEVSGLVNMKGGVPLGLAVISLLSGLDAEGWLKEVRGLWPWIGLEAGGAGGCDVIERVRGTGAGEGSLKEKFGTSPTELGLLKVNGVTVVAGAVVEIEARLSVIDEGA